VPRPPVGHVHGQHAADDVHAVPEGDQRTIDAAGSQTLWLTVARRSIPTVTTSTAAAKTAQQSSRKGRWVTSSRRAMLQVRSSARSLIVVLPTAG
jgi:hypothetical protein